MPTWGLALLLFSYCLLVKQYLVAAESTKKFYMPPGGMGPIGKDKGGVSV